MSQGKDQDGESGASTSVEVPGAASEAEWSVEDKVKETWEK